MAQELGDLELWLPSEFLTDDDVLTDFKTQKFGSKSNDDFWYGFGNSFGFSSDLSSPVPSATGTMETESDEDEFISELTRKVARSTLRDNSLSSEITAESWKLPGSPQSTLCGCKPAPGVESNFVSRVCSPQEAKDVQRWDLLCAAAEEAARMRMIEETAAFYSSKLFGQSPEPTPITKSSHQNPNPVPNFYRNQAPAPMLHTYHQLEAACFQQMKKQQLTKNGGVLGQGMVEYHNGRRNGGRGRHQPQGPSMSAWPTLQQSQLQQHQPGSGMTAVFLGETGKKKERIGTGVFMPRRFVSNPPTEPRKKSGCSTVLLPDKVVHALNWNPDPIDPRGVQPRLLHGRTNVGPQPALNQELRLPQEWTY